MLPPEIHSTLYAGFTMIIARQITQNLKICPNVRNTFKPANIRVMARFANWFTRVLAPLHKPNTYKTR